MALGADENGMISRRCHRVGRLPAGEVFSLRADPRLAVWTRHHDAAPGYLQEFLPGASLLGRDREIDKTDLLRAAVMVDLLKAARIFVGMTVNEILARLKSLGDDARRAHGGRVSGTCDSQKNQE